jgi:hypothetical protein
MKCEITVRGDAGEILFQVLASEVHISESREVHPQRNPDGSASVLIPEKSSTINISARVGSPPAKIPE